MEYNDWQIDLHLLFTESKFIFQITYDVLNIKLFLIDKAAY